MSKTDRSSLDQQRHLQGGFSFGMRGIKGDSAIEADIKIGPGVGKYELEKGYKGIQRNSSMPRFKEAKRFDTIKDADLTPGPGEYSPTQRQFRNVPTKKNGHSFSDASRLCGSLFEINSSNNLGPGYYFTEQSDNNTGNNNHNISSTSRSTSSKLLNQGSLFLSTLHRLNSNTSTPSLVLSPVKTNSNSSPIKAMDFGGYSKRTDISITANKNSIAPPVGLYTLPTSNSSISVGFPKSKRYHSLHNTENCSPGPAQYSISTTTSQQSFLPITTMTTSKRSFGELPLGNEITPGPGMYSKDSLEELKYKKTAVFSFGKQTKSSPFKWDYEPAPSCYQPFTAPIGLSAKIGSSDRPGVGNNVPGVGAYTLSTERETEKAKTQREEFNKLQKINNSITAAYKARLMQKKCELIKCSPNLSQSASGYPLASLQSLNTPSPAYYDNLLGVVKEKKKTYFPKAKRTEDFLDVFGKMKLHNRSPGPALYAKNETISDHNGVTVAKQKKKELFEIDDNPGVGCYNIDKGSSFNKFQLQKIHIKPIKGNEKETKDEEQTNSPGKKHGLQNNNNLIKQQIDTIPERERESERLSTC